MVTEAPTTADQRGAEGTGRHFITFESPSNETRRELHINVINGVNIELPLARVEELPVGHPFSSIAVDFKSWLSLG